VLEPLFCPNRTVSQMLPRYRKKEFVMGKRPARPEANKSTLTIFSQFLHNYTTFD